jgi:polyhydroxybutyrate depolymerase
MQHRFSALHHIAAAIALVCVCSCSDEYTVEVGEGDLDRLDTLQSGGIERIFEIHLPPNYETASPPVVILFHRAGSNGLDMRYLTSFDVEANFYGFLAVYPYAAADWAYGCDCTTAEDEGVDDVQFVVDLLDTLEAAYNINRDSVFVAGFAEGALMAQKVVCDAAESFAGLATVGATMSLPVAEACAPSREMPVLMILGREDEEFPWNGAPNLGALSLLSADSTAQFWATQNGCGERTESAYVGFDTYYDFEVYREGFDACPAGGNVILYRMERAGHGWPNGEFQASDEIAFFFSGT